MGNWNPQQPLPSQLADAFATLYDWFVVSHREKAENRGWGGRLLTTSSYDALREEVELSDGVTPRSLQDHLSDASHAGEEAVVRASYQCLRAIDEGLWQTSAYVNEDSDPGGAQEIIRASSLRRVEGRRGRAVSQRIKARQTVPRSKVHSRVYNGVTLASAWFLAGALGVRVEPMVSQ